MLQPLDGPALSGVLSATTTAQEVKVNATVLEERKLISVTPTDGKVWYGYDNTVTSLTGTRVTKNQTLFLEASSSLPVYIVTASGTVDVRITEVA